VFFVLLPSVGKTGFWGENNALIRLPTKIAKSATPPLPLTQREKPEKTPFFCGFSGFFGGSPKKSENAKKTCFSRFFIKKRPFFEGRFFDLFAGRALKKRKISFFWIYR
jgi:hypothetical protein